MPKNANESIVPYAITIGWKMNILSTYQGRKSYKEVGMDSIIRNSYPKEGSFPLHQKTNTTQGRIEEANPTTSISIFQIDDGEVWGIKSGNELIKLLIIEGHTTTPIMDM